MEVNKGNVMAVNLFLSILGKQSEVSGIRRYLLGSCISDLEEDTEFRNDLIELLNKTKERYNKKL